MRAVIAGAGGGVGASVAFNLLVSPLECEVVMVDARQNMVHSHLWDLEQVLEQNATGSVRAGSADDIAGADVLVMTAAAPLWDHVTVDGERVTLDDAQRGEVMAFVGGWYTRHVALNSGRSSTWTSGLGIARMVGACVDVAGDALWPPR